MDQKEPQVEVSWLPTTPAKPILTKPVPICEPEEQNQQLGCKHDNEAVACHEFSAGAVPGTTLANSVSGNGKPCVQTASDKFSGWSKLGFSELLFLTEAGSGILPDNRNGLENPLIPSLMSQFKGDVQGTSHTACCSKETSDDKLTPDNAIRAESKEIASMHINVEEKGPRGEEENISAKKLGDNGTPPSKELSEPVVEYAAAVSTQLNENDNPDYASSHDIDLSKTPQQKPKRRRKHRPKVIIEGKPKRTRKPATQKPVQAKDTPTVKRKYVRKRGLINKSIPPTEMMGELTEEIIPESAKQPCRRSLNFDIGPRDESSACRENATAHLGKETGVVEQQTNVVLSHDLSTSTSPSKENPPEKRKYARRKKISKTSAPTIKVTGELSKAVMTESAKTSCGKSLDLGIGARDQSSAGIENETVHLGNEIDVAAQETNVGLAYDLKTSTEKASNNYMPLSKDTQAPSISPSKSTPPAAEAKEDATSKRKYVRRRGPNKSTLPPAEMTAALTEPVVPDSTNMSWRSSSGRQNLSEHISMDNSSKQELDSYMSLPEDIQAPRISPARSNSSVAKPEEKAASKRKYARRKRLSNSSTPPTEMTEDLIQPTMLKSTEIEQRRSLYFNAGARGETSACRQNLNVHNGKENSVVAEGTHVGLTYDQSTSKKQALYNFMSLPEDTLVPNASSKSNPPGAKLNANSVKNRSRKNGQATVQDGHENSAKLLLKSVRESSPNDSNISNSQISMLRLQMVGSKRSHSGTVRFADTSSMNEIGAYYNGFPSYQNMFRIQFPNLQKRRRSENGKSSNASITSCATTIKEAELTFSQEVAQVHPYASSSSCWNFCSEYNAARVPTISEATGSVIDDDKAFEEFKLSLRRAQIYNSVSLTRIRNFDTEPNYSAHELCIYDRQTFGNAQRPQTSIDALVTETSASFTKNKNKSFVSSSSYSTINEMQQCQKFALGDYHQSLAIPSEVIRAIMQQVNALSEKLSQLNINEEAKDLALVPYKKSKKKRSLVNGDGTIIPFHGSYSPIRKQLPRPKVDIDEETDRVWKLLMLDINSHGIDGTDEDKAKWWEDERNVFRGRADSFIARMHLVQGDRRFTRWKGSVLDSVVGVFLTQNVSDHLSSSAFMSLAARFPKKFSKTYHGEGTGLVASEPQVHIVEPEESTEWDSKILDHSSMAIDIAEPSGEKDDNSSSRTTGGVISITYESSCRLSESSTGKQYSPMRSGLISTTSEEGEEKSCYDGVRKELNNLVSSQGSVISSQISGDSSKDQNPEKIGSCSDSNSEVEDLSSTTKHNSFYNSTSFSKLVEMASSSKLYEVNSKKCNSTENIRDAFSLGMTHDNPTENLEKSNLTQGSLEASIIPSHPIEKDTSRNEINEISSAPVQLQSRGQAKDKNEDINWDILRIEAQAKAGKREKTKDTMDSLDWEAVRCADVNVIANTIKERGMNNRLADRIKNFLNRLVEEHGDIDLEWLRDVPPDQAKEYLLSVKGLGLKSVECVRLLTLHHLAFPVDTNVGRIAVRLGWVPIQPLPESLQLHLLELYELHYQMITFGKVFCTKSKPNCNACPMRAECRHFASAFASARLALPGPEQKSIVSTSGNNVNDQNPPVIFNQLYLQPAENTNQAEDIQQTELSRQLYPKPEINSCQPIIEEPTTPDPECSQLPQDDIEDAFYYDDSCEIPTIKLNMEEFTTNLQNYMQENMALQEGEMSKALVSLNPEAASIPVPKLKNVSRLRTEHCVYELPDTHPLLEGWDTREPDDPGKYLLAIWTPGETADSIQPPGSKCNSLECGQLCNEKECFSCNSFREANSQTVRGTILIPCRTAMRGSFPLNGTYFQVNEVFADHDSSLDPISVPRSWIWNLNRRTVYFGTSIPTIFKGLSTQDIQQCFWRGYVCVRGFDKKTRAPRPLMARLHFPVSKMPKTTEKTRKKSTPAASQGLEPNPEHSELEPELITNGHNLQETASKMGNTKEKKRKRSKPKNSKGLKPNPEQPQLITNGDRLQETDIKVANAKEKTRNKPTPKSSPGSKPNQENRESIPDGPNLQEAATA
ncbi:hypothetical protein Lal_00037592 [Lupinus albus]|nr:hypothetical protein Lal_00037592 [Lupinus albus]